MPFPTLGLGGMLLFDEKPALGPMKRAGKQFGQLGDESGRFVASSKKASGSMLSFGSIMKTAGIAGGLAGITFGIRKVVDLTSEFEVSLAKINTLLDETSPPIEKIGKDMLQLSDRFGVGTKAMSEGMFQAISAGVDAADSMDFMGIASQAAVGGFTDVTTAVDGLTTFMNVYGIKSMEEMRRVSDSVFVANKLGKTTFEEISASVGRAAATAKGAGVSYNELLSTVVAVTKGGVRTAEVMSGLKAALAGIGKPTKDAQDEARRLGIQFSTAALQTKGWNRFLKEIAVTTKGDKKSIEKLFGSVEAGNVIMTLASKEGFADFTEAVNAMAEGAGTTAEAFKKASSTSAHEWKRLTTTISNAAIRLGTRLAGTFSGTFDSISDSISTFSQALDEVMVIDFTDTRRSLTQVDELSKKYGRGMVNTARMVSGAIDTIRQVFGTLSKAVKGVFSVLNATVGSFVRGFLDFIMPIKTALVSLYDAVAGVFDTLFGWLLESTGSTTGGMKGMFKSFGQFVGFVILRTVEGLADIIRMTADAIKLLRGWIQKGISYVHEFVIEVQRSRGLITEGEAKAARKRIKGVRDWVGAEMKGVIQIRQEAEKRRKELDKLGEAATDVGVAPARGAAAAAAAAAAVGKRPPPAVNLDLKNTMCIDGREVGHAITRQQQQIQERAGFKTKPWQRRTSLEHGAMPATLSVGVA